MRLEARLRSGHACSVLPAEAGWYATIRVPRVLTDEELALRALDVGNVLVQPGYFYDFERDGLIVTSLLTPPGVFDEGVDRLVAILDDLLV
jgi:alanine-synthesizing transaminase